MRERAQPRSLAALLLALALPGPGLLSNAAKAEEPVPPGPGTVALDIRNDTVLPVRCVVMLAHFVTRDVAEIAPGELRRLLLVRDAATGTLAYGEHAGAPMFVENILCGAAAGWEDRHAGIALDALRVSPVSHYRAVCGFADSFGCAIVDAAIAD